MMKIDPSIIGFDIDGVVADTMHLFLDIAREDHGITDVGYEDINRYFLDECLPVESEIIGDILTKLLDGTRDQGLKPIAGAPDVLGRIGKRFGPVRFVTARTETGVIRDWLERHLPLDASEIDVVATGSFDAKPDVLKEKGISCFVEDRLETCFLVADNGIRPVLFRQPWNRDAHPFAEVGTWRELEAMIDF